MNGKEQRDSRSSLQQYSHETQALYVKYDAVPYLPVHIRGRLSRFKATAAVSDIHSERGISVAASSLDGKSVSFSEQVKLSGLYGALGEDCSK